jgi:transglutaminase-like putative cysteine protease
MWGERIGRRRVGGAMGVCFVAVVAALIAAPALDLHQPWFDYRTLAGGLRPSGIEGFDWSQGYGPLDWPRTGHVVLEVQASHPEYWKAENLDLFNGIGWAQGTVGRAMPRIPASSLKRWQQTLTVTIRDMRTTTVLGAGVSDQPTNLTQLVAPGPSPGTWTASGLSLGDSYRVRVYDPTPTPAQLLSSGSDYTGLSPGYLSIELPPAPGTPSQDVPFMTGQPARGHQATLIFPSFHSRSPILISGAPPQMTGAEAIRASVYNRAYALAQQLSAGAATPYQFVQAVERHLANGYVYNERPGRSSYPLESFLFTTHRGYCQQFAGAMALLLRMGGVPARVAAGFTTGHYDQATKRWLVTDYDAHAWVEAWFPSYGWVRLDPTPTGAPARSGHTPITLGGPSNPAATGTGLSASKIAGGGVNKRRGVSGSGRGSTHPSTGSSSDLPWIVTLAVLFAVVVSMGVVATRPLRSIDALVSELEVALRRMGRPLPAGATLTWLERRVGRSEDASAYVRALRLARFGGGLRLPTRAQRRALRRQLRLGVGLFGGLRAIWALPPRWARWRIRADRGSGA